MPLSRRVTRLVVSILIVAATMASFGETGSESLAYRPRDPLNQTAFNHFYNLDFDRAVQEFQVVLDRHPDDAFALNHLLSATLFRELYRMGVLNTGEYANDTFISAPHRTADTEITQRIKNLAERAFKLEEKRLAANPDDVEALYARGVTRGQFATYTALIERAWFSALRSAVGARRDHERVLDLSPSTVEAKLIVGTHNYVIGNLPWGMKAAASMMGLGGNKAKGLEYLKECAQGTGETSIDAQILLAVFLRREHRYDEALTIVRSLTPRFPQDVLLALEEGHLLRASGRNPEAADVYRRVWQAGKDGHYPGLHYEIAALSLGDLLRNQKDYNGAALAYELVKQAPHSDPDASQKADLGAGEMYDLLHHRDLAIAKYQAVVADNASSGAAEIARKRMKDAYKAD